MKNITVFLALVLCILGFGSSAHAQVTTSAIDTSDRTADHETLRAMLSTAEKAANEGRFDDLMKYLDPNVNIIYQNAEVADGIPEVKAFEEKIFKGNGGVLKNIQTKITADKLTEFYGNTAIAYGTSVDHYTFIAGLEMDSTSKWSATLIKEKDDWKVVSLQFTSNIFDNPLLASAQKANKYYALGGLVLGLILGFFGYRFLRRNKV